MVKKHNISLTLPYSWTQVTQLFFHRYPNPFSMHVLSCDTISRFMTPDGNLYTKRLMTKVNKVPRRGKIIYYMYPNFQPKAYVIEESLIDLKNRLIYTITRNIGFSTTFMSVTEVNMYEAHKTDTAHKTIVRKEATVESRFYGLRRRMEAFGVHRFKKNSDKAHRGFLYVLDKQYKSNNSEDNESQASNSTACGHGSIIDKYFNMHNCTRLFARLLAKIT